MCDWNLLLERAKEFDAMQSTHTAACECVRTFNARKHFDIRRSTDFWEAFDDIFHEIFPNPVEYTPAPTQELVCSSYFSCCLSFVLSFSFSLSLAVSRVFSRFLASSLSLFRLFSRSLSFCPSLETVLPASVFEWKSNVKCIDFFLFFLSNWWNFVNKWSIQSMSEVNYKYRKKLPKLWFWFLFDGADDTMFEKFSLRIHLHIFTYTNTIYICIWPAAHIKDRLPDTQLTNVYIYIYTYIYTYVWICIYVYTYIYTCIQYICIIYIFFRCLWPCQQQTSRANRPTYNWAGKKSDWLFSKISFVVIFHGKLSSKLTFENFDCGGGLPHAQSGKNSQKSARY